MHPPRSLPLPAIAARSIMQVLQALLCGAWPAWLPDAARPSAPLAAFSADALSRLHADAAALPLPQPLRAALATLLGATGRGPAAAAAAATAELAPCAPLSAAAPAPCDPWMLLEGGCGAAAEPPRALALLAGAVRVPRR
jgi:hypothetical protein